MSRATDWALRIGAILAALILSSLILVLLGASPAATLNLIWQGSFGTFTKLDDVLTAWVPVLLCCAGLLITFAAGLWNIGIEGQIVIGAIFATGALRATQGALPPALALILAALAGLAGGALWALLAGALKLYGQVNEIFGGLGLNFIAGSLTVYLVLGPWKRPGIGSTSGTQPFGPDLWLPAFPGFPVSPVEIALGILVLLLVYVALRGTYFGLRLKAIGKNLPSAFLLGVPTNRYMLVAFALCGALAGLAGWVLVVGTSSRHQLFPLISGGFGFQAILVVLLSSLNAIWSVPISLFFAAISIGSLQLALQAQLDSSLGGVIQGMLVLAVLLMGGLRERLVAERK